MTMQLMSRDQAISTFGVYYVLRSRGKSEWSAEEAALGCALSERVECLGRIEADNRGFAFASVFEAEDHAIRVWHAKLKAMSEEDKQVLETLTPATMLLARLWIRKWRPLSRKLRQRMMEAKAVLPARIALVEKALNSRPFLPIKLLPAFVRIEGLLPIGTEIHVILDQRAMNGPRFGRGNITAYYLGEMTGAAGPEPHLPVRFVLDYAWTDEAEETAEPKQIILEMNEINTGDGDVVRAAYGAIFGQSYYLNPADAAAAVKDGLKRFIERSERAITSLKAAAGDA